MSKLHHVHVYTAIRVKIAVIVEDHADAMGQAEAIVGTGVFPVRLYPGAPNTAVGRHIIFRSRLDYTSAVGSTVLAVGEPASLRGMAASRPMSDTCFSSCFTQKRTGVLR